MTIKSTYTDEEMFDAWKALHDLLEKVLAEEVTGMGNLMIPLMTALTVLQLQPPPIKLTHLER